MSFYVKIPISTEVIESNPDCKINGVYKNKTLVITIDTRNENIHQRLGLGTKTRLYWGKKRSFEIQELSSVLWPIRYRVLAREGYYMDDQNKKICFTTNAYGIDQHRHVSKVLMRSAILLLVIAGMGFRRTSWLLKILFHVNVSKSSLQRWVGEVADEIPNRDKIIELLNEKHKISEGHLDEFFPLGMNHCVLVLKDEHGRILATQKVDKRDEENVKPFLQKFKDLGLSFRAFYTDGCKAYYNAIREIFGNSVAIQYDYFHIIQNAWRHLWKWSVFHRRDVKSRSEKVKSKWYKKKLETLATSLWKNRYLLFTAEEKLTPEERICLTEIVEADQKVGNLRAFLSGVWNIFENSQDEIDAKIALAILKQKEIDKQNPKQFQKVINFLEGNFEWMTAFLRYDNVKRNSLSETGMRVLRRLELEHDGFRSEKGREDFLRIYQAIKYLGWKVHRGPPQKPKILMG